MILTYNYWYFDKGIPGDICENIIQRGKELKPEVALTGTNEDPAQQDFSKRKSKISWIDEHWLYKLLHPFVQEANRQAGWNFEFSHSEAVQFTTYKAPGEHYDWHYDFNEKDNSIRKLSCVVSLSDPTEYKGGMFQLYPSNVMKNPQVIEVSELKPKGTVLIFPSFLWHKVAPITEGIRYSAVTWYRGEKFK